MTMTSFEVFDIRKLSKNTRFSSVFQPNGPCGYCPDATPNALNAGYQRIVAFPFLARNSFAALKWSHRTKCLWV